jgi:hypothetical protein
MISLPFEIKGLEFNFFSNHSLRNNDDYIMLDVIYCIFVHYFHLASELNYYVWC